MRRFYLRIVWWKDGSGPRSIWCVGGTTDGNYLNGSHFGRIHHRLLGVQKVLLGHHLSRYLLFDTLHDFDEVVRNGACAETLRNGLKIKNARTGGPGITKTNFTIL